MYKHLNNECAFMQIAHFSSSGHWLFSKASQTATLSVSCLMMSLYLSASPGLRSFIYTQNKLMNEA